MRAAAGRRWQLALVAGLRPQAMPRLELMLMNRSLLRMAPSSASLARPAVS